MERLDMYWLQWGIKGSCINHVKQIGLYIADTDYEKHVQPFNLTMEIRVTGQNGIEQNGTEKMSRTKW